MIPFVGARLTEFGKSTVAWVGEPQRSAAVGLTELPRNRMFATSSANKKDVARAWTIGGRYSHSEQVSRRGIAAGESRGTGTVWQYLRPSCERSVTIGGVELRVGACGLTVLSAAAAG
jgi:hypothetical protein